jgi:DNA-binding IclR family transcriptional regulator
LTESAAQEHRTVSRVTTILEAVASARRGVRLTDLARMLGAPKSSVHGLTKGLVATGYLVELNGTYTLGPAVGALLNPPRPTLLQAAQPAMVEIQQEWDETVALCSLVGDSVVYVDLVESTQAIRYSAPLRTRRPLYPTSAGKCFLAFMRESRVESYLKDFPVDSRRAILAELAEVRASGLGYNRGETVPDVTAVASPIMVAGRPAACLNVAGPTARMGSKLAGVAERLLAVTDKAARALS